MTSQILNKLLHLPTIRMKEAAVTRRAAYADAVRHLFGLEDERVTDGERRIERPLPFVAPSAFMRVRRGPLVRRAAGCEGDLCSFASGLAAARLALTQAEQAARAACAARASRSRSSRSPRPATATARGRSARSASAASS